MHEAFGDEELFVACNQLATNASEYVKDLILSLNTQCLSKQELQLATSLATKSRQYFERVAFKPAQSLGLIEPVAGDPVHSPKTVYRLTKLGLALCEKLRENLPVPGPYERGGCGTVPGGCEYEGYGGALWGKASQELLRIFLEMLSVSEKSCNFAAEKFTKVSRIREKIIVISICKVLKIR